MEKLSVLVEPDGGEVKLLVTKAGESLLVPAHSWSMEHEIASVLAGFKKGKAGVFERELDDGVVLKVAEIPPGEGNRPGSTVACVMLSRYADGYEKPLAAFEFTSLGELFQSISVAERRRK